MAMIEFVGSDDLVGRAIQLFTWSDFDHVQFIVGGKRLGAMPGQGVVLIDPKPAPRRQQFTVNAPDKVLDYAKSQLGKPYDYTAIAGIALHRDWREDDSWFCSELVAWAFEQAAYPLVRADRLNRITPRDLLLSPRLNGPL